MDADIQAAEGEHKAAARRRAVGGALAAQACAFLNAVTAVTSASIAGHGVDVPTFQVRACAQSVIRVRPRQRSLSALHVRRACSTTASWALSTVLGGG